MTYHVGLGILDAALEIGHGWSADDSNDLSNEGFVDGLIVEQLYQGRQQLLNTVLVEMQDGCTSERRLKSSGMLLSSTTARRVLRVVSEEAPWPVVTLSPIQSSMTDSFI